MPPHHQSRCHLSGGILPGCCGPWLSASSIPCYVKWRKRWDWTQERWLLSPVSPLPSLYVASCPVVVMAADHTLLCISRFHCTGTHHFRRCDYTFQNADPDSDATWHMTSGGPGDGVPRRLLYVPWQLLMSVLHFPCPPEENSASRSNPLIWIPGHNLQVFAQSVWYHYTSHLYFPVTDQMQKHVPNANQVSHLYSLQSLTKCKNMCQMQVTWPNDILVHLCNSSKKQFLSVCKTPPFPTFRIAMIPSKETHLLLFHQPFYSIPSACYDKGQMTNCQSITIWPDLSQGFLTSDKWQMTRSGLMSSYWIGSYDSWQLTYAFEQKPFNGISIKLHHIITKQVITIHLLTWHQLPPPLAPSQLCRQTCQEHLEGKIFWILLFQKLQKACWIL